MRKRAVCSGFMLISTAGPYPREAFSTSNNDDGTFWQACSWFKERTAMGFLLKHSREIDESAEDHTEILASLPARLTEAA